MSLPEPRKSPVPMAPPMAMSCRWRFLRPRCISPCGGFVVVVVDMTLPCVDVLAMRSEWMLLAGSRVRRRRGTC
ncbi:hypothetical protein ACFPRL_19390 [Pseudoclavibacter helvolus]